MDPVLAARFARQKEKLETGKSDVVDVGSVADSKKNLDPVLAKRWEKLQTGQCRIEDNIGSVADNSRKLDPVLAKRWSQQQEKLEKGEVPAEIGSAADKSTKLDPVLAERWAATHQRLLTGKSGIDADIGSKAAYSSLREDSELAKRFAQLEVKSKQGSHAVAERSHLSFSAGESVEHRVPWEVSAGGSGNLQWSAVVLSDLTIDLEILAVLQCGSEEATQELLLQRNARGGTFVGSFDEARDRRLAAANSTGNARKEVKEVVFKFSNSFSWFRGKEVELVILLE
eukprot:TRINITY_DN94105_c0_g1_i1.p1 TRINITY_DN94105_c0_g1~~TRINITY_DN94105_c0_g1_i1.p1  ORF type:complete len:285 (+),score=83.85 TRINITY_DN94105_c0_g1_i1:27-881(+)